MPGFTPGGLVISTIDIDSNPPVMTSPLQYHVMHLFNSNNKRKEGLSRKCGKCGPEEEGAVGGIEVRLGRKGPRGGRREQYREESEGINLD